MKKKNKILMTKPTIYLNQRIRKDVVKRLRKYERENKLRSSISNTIENLLNKSEYYEPTTN